MSAMPEREVFATELNEQEWLASYLREAMKMAEKLVPESRLLAAEARVREVEAERDVEYQRINDRLTEILPHVTALRAERDALVPLARFGMASLDDNTENYGPSAELDHAASFGVFTRITHNDGGVSWDDTPATTQARAILAREVGA